MTKHKIINVTHFSIEKGKFYGGDLCKSLTIELTTVLRGNSRWYFCTSGKFRVMFPYPILLS